MLEYVVKFIELARFADDYVAIDMAKVRKFKDGLKLSIMKQNYGISSTRHGLDDYDNYGH